MRLLHEQVMGAIVIAGLVSIGLLIAEEPELPGWINGRSFIRSTGDSSPTFSCTQVEWSANGTRLLVQSRGGLNAQKTLFVHDLTTSTGHVPQWAGAMGAISDASLSPDGVSVVVATHSGELWWIDIETSSVTELARSRREAPFVATAIGPDGRLMAGGTDDGDIFLCDPTHGVTTTLKESQPTAVMKLRFSNDGRQLLCTRADGIISVWDTSTGALTCELPGRMHIPTAASFLAGGHRILSSGTDNALHLWDVATGAQVWRGARGTFGNSGIQAMDVAATGSLAAWADALNKRIVVWDLETQQKVLELTNPSVVLHVRFSPDGSTLAVAGSESIVRLYDVRTGVELGSIDLARLLTAQG